MSERIAKLKDRLCEALDLRGKKSKDLVTDLDIPASAISQYLNGKSQNMTEERLSAICKYLDVSEPWMMGYDVTRERMTAKKNDIISDAVVNMRNDQDYLDIVVALNSMDTTKRRAIKTLLSPFLEDSND